MKLIKPYSDDKMIYDFDEHRYILTLEYVEDKTGVNLVEKLQTSASDNPQKVAEFFLDRVSSNIYTWIYQHNANNTMQEFYLARIESARNIIMKAMMEQVMYMITNGDISLYSGVNLTNGQIMNRKEMQNASIGINVERILDTIIPEIGISITYQGWIPYPLNNDEIRRDY